MIIQHFRGNRKLRYKTTSFQYLLTYFRVYTGISLALPHSRRNLHFSRHNLKIDSRFLQIETIHIYTIQHSSYHAYVKKSLIIFRVSLRELSTVGGFGV